MLRLLLRNIFFLPVFVLTTAIVASTIILVSKLPRSTRFIRTIEVYWAKITVFASGVRVEADEPALDPTQNYIFLSNHQSHLDIPIILSRYAWYFPRFLAKDSLFRIPLFGPGMRRTGHLSVNRENKRQGMKDVQHAVEQIQNGESVLIFPEGTRNTTDKPLQDFQIGSFIIALKAGAPVIPLVLDGTRKILPKGSILIRPGTVKLTALPPIDINAEYTLKQRDLLKEEVYTIMHKQLTELG
jgi:1-acyl-sn-glycerol-3-phosphate acyltransferase